MTVVEDAFVEMLQEFGEDITLYKHQGYQDEGDDFWHNDAGWDENNPQTIRAILTRTVDNEKLKAWGLDPEETDFAIKTHTDVVEEGDRLEWANESYIVTRTVERRYEAEGMMWIVSVQQFEV